MNRRTQQFLEIECPKCHAAAGKHCFGQQAGVAHFERLNAVPHAKHVSALGSQPIHRPGPHPTAACGRFKSHRHCKGRHARRYGLPGEPCTCSCHKKELEPSVGLALEAWK